MRLITYASGPNGLPRLGVRVGHRVLDVEAASRVDGEPLPSTMKGLLREGRGALSRVRALAKAAQASAGRFSTAMLEEKAIRFLPPVPDPGRFEGGDESGPALVFVIGRRAFGLDGDDDPLDYVVGVTILSQGARGPERVTCDEIGDPAELWITCSVNGESRLRVHPGDHGSRMSEALERFSRDAALEPGDLFSTGGAGELALQVGDVVECSIEGLTTLTTTVAAP